MLNVLLPLLFARLKDQSTTVAGLAPVITDIANQSIGNSSLAEAIGDNLVKVANEWGITALNDAPLTVNAIVWGVYMAVIFFVPDTAYKRLLTILKEKKS